MRFENNEMEHEKHSRNLCPIHTIGGTSCSYRFSEVAEPPPRMPHMDIWFYHSNYR